MGTKKIILGVLFRPGVHIFRPHYASVGRMGQFWPWAKNGPNSPETGPGDSEAGASGFSIPVCGQNPLRQRVGCLSVVYCPFFCPNVVSVGPIWAISGPDCGPQSKPENWPNLGLDGPNSNSESTFSQCQPPILVASTPQNGPNAPIHMVCARRLPV